MNITEGEVQEYDELSGFSPVDSSSAWDVLSGSADDLGAVDFNVKQDHVFLESTSPTFANQADNSPQWGSSGSFAMVQPTCSSSSSVKRSMRDTLREVKVSEEVLRGAVANLGGGAHGLRVLMDLVCFWTSSPEAQVGDMTATIRKGIVDLSNNVPPHHSAFDVNLQWKHYGTTGCDPKQRGSAYTRALRKSHIVRQRKHPPRAQRTSKQPCGHPYRGQWRNNEARQSWLHDLDPELGHDNGKGYSELVDAPEYDLVDAQGYEFLFQKELRASDVSSLGRIVLPKKDAERHLPFLVVREGMMISLEDYHSGTFWTARYRFWPNNKSRMYLLENIGGFVSFHRLQEGDFLLCYRNQQGGYVIRGQKVPASVRAPAKSLNPTGTTVAKETTTETASSEITTEMKTVDSTSQFMESGEHSATNTADSRSNSSFDSLECSFHPPAPSPVRYHNLHKTDLLKSGTYGPVVEMLLVSNVKHRFMEEDAT